MNDVCFHGCVFVYTENKKNPENVNAAKGPLSACVANSFTINALGREKN